MRRVLLGSLALAAAATLGCGGPPAPTPVAPTTAAPSPAPASPTLTDVEAALLAAQAWRAEVVITATGALTAQLEASALVASGGRVLITARGELMGKPVDLRWASDGTRTTAGEATPPALGEAVAIGLVRMGLLHNVARLAMGSGTAPDHASGGARAWVVAVEPQAHGADVSYRLRVDGKEAADVVVTIDPRRAQGPVLTHRRITVHFERGDMVVEEAYRVDLEVELPSDAFTVGGGA